MNAGRVESATPPTLPPHVRFTTHKQQDCRDSRDSQSTVLSETVTAVSFSALPTVACSQKLVHSKTAGYLKAATSTCFWLTTLVVTLTDIRRHHRYQHRSGMSKKHRHRPNYKFMLP